MLRIFLIIILFIVNLSSNETIKNYKELARKGDIQANFYLGKIYFNGKIVKQDLDSAMKYFKRASIYENQKALYNIATIYAQKRYSNFSLRKSYNLFLDLAQKGNPKAQNKIGLFLLHGLGVDKDYKLSVRWFEQSYFKGNYKPAACNLSLMYASGKGVFPNFGRARELADVGLKDKIPTCVKTYKEFNLQKYEKDKGFKYGFYK